MNLKNKPLTYKYKCSNNPVHLFEKPTGDFWCPLCNISTRPMLIPFIEHVETKETTIADDIASNQTFRELSTEFQEVFEKPNTQQNIDFNYKLGSNVGEDLDTIKLGSQIWMAENLDTDKFRNGDFILEAKSPKEWRKFGKAKQPAWCYPRFHPEYSIQQGKLYNLFAISDPRGIAPMGFHVPTDLEWEIADEIFNYLPRGGYIDFNGEFGLIGVASYYWTNHQFITYPKNLRFLGSIFGYKRSGFSVRCIKD